MFDAYTFYFLGGTMDGYVAGYACYGIGYDGGESRIGEVYKGIGEGAGGSLRGAG